MCDCVVLACCGACAIAVFLAGLYLTFGIIFITLAARAKSAVLSHQVLITSDLSLYPNLCIAIGVFFTLLTILGLVGEKNGKKTRIVYVIAQLLVIGLGIGTYAGAYPNEVKVEEHIFQGLTETLHGYGENMTAGKNLTLEWDLLQENWLCCGVKNFLDWEEVELTPKIPTPISCCREDHRMRGCSSHVRFDHPAESNKLIYVQGCLEEVRSELLGRMGILNYFLAPILVTTIFGCLVSCCSSGVKKDTEKTEEKKLGPIVIRTNTKKRKSADVENPAEEGSKEDNDDAPKAIEMAKIEAEDDPKISVA